MGKPRPYRRISQEEIIRQFRDVHGDRYDYSKVEYTGIDNRVIIICSEHGEFSQSPYSHRKGSNCGKCSGRGLSNEDWIERFRSAHGDKFDYSKVNYRGTDNKVTIICREHGDWEQIPHSHLRGNGCPKCYGRGKTREDWIGEARMIHGDRYDYSKTNYIDTTTKLTITCTEHGDFDMLPGNHTHLTRPQNCPRCRIHGKPISTDEFVQRSSQKFGRKFDYNQVDYVNMNTPIVIGCDVHGLFEINPIGHLISPTGCPQCSNEQTGMNQRRSREDVIAAFTEKHGTRYDYSKVNYKGAEQPVTIICEEHGEFQQRPHTHLGSASGCPDCALLESGLSRRLTVEQVIERAIQVHGDWYDYSKVEYETIEDRITIICPEHGEFVQQVNNHINQGSGCNECGLVKSGLSRRISKEEWIERFTKRHGELYDYSKFEAVLTSEKGMVICREHGEFLQEPSSHAKGHGCPLCLKKNQTLVYNFVKEIFPNEEVIYDYRHPNLRFKESNAKMELDIWVPHVSLGIEYQGEQHFHEFWEGWVELRENQTLENTLRRDEEKRIACANYGIALVEIPYTWKATIDYVKDALDRHGIEFDTR